MRIKNGVNQRSDGKKARPEKKTKLRWSVVLIVGVILTTIASLSWFTYTAYINSNDGPSVRSTVEFPIIKPWGRIISPVTGQTIQRHFKISGETRNIPKEHKLVLVLDVGGIRLFWPHKPLLKPNTRFTVDSYEAGPEGEFKLFLYAIDEKYFDLNKEWFDDKKVGEIPRIPIRYLLDSVVLKVKSSNQ